MQSRIKVQVNKKNSCCSFIDKSQLYKRHITKNDHPMLRLITKESSSALKWRTLLAEVTPLHYLSEHGIDEGAEDADRKAEVTPLHHLPKPEIEEGAEDDEDNERGSPSFTGKDGGDDCEDEKNYKNWGRMKFPVSSIPSSCNQPPRFEVSSFFHP